MEQIDLSYMGFFLNWSFVDDLNVGYEDFLKDKKLTLEMRNDIINILEYLEEQRLLKIRYFTDDNGNKIFIKSVNDLLIRIQQKIFSGDIKGEISEIGGDGLIYLDNNMRKIQKNLVIISSFRLFERNFTISTSKNIWTPIDFDINHDYKWQINLARLNAIRLEKCLLKIHRETKTKMIPDILELNKDNVIWQLGYKVFLSESFLLREYNKLQFKPDISDFLLPDSADL